MKILKIGDFGLSKISSEAIKQTLKTYNYDTTIAYKAPEVIKMQEATSKVDIWALGVILYQLLTSTHPFIKDELCQTEIAIRDLEPSPPLPSSINEDNKKIVQALL